MRFIITTMLIFLASNALAERQYRLLDIEALDLTYLKLDPNNRIAYAPEYTGEWGTEARLDWNISIYHYLFWKNQLHTSSIGSSGAVKTVGWQWTAGIRLLPELDVIAYHHSQHIMDEESQVAQRFPVENGYGFTVHFLTGH